MLHALKLQALSSSSKPMCLWNGSGLVPLQNRTSHCYTGYDLSGNICSYWIFIKYTSLYWADPVFEMSKLLSKTRYFPSRLIEARGTAQ